jgi:hypothetical protein
MPDWDGGVADVYRFQLSTGTKQKFAIIPDIGRRDIMAPSAFKLFAGIHGTGAVPMPDPPWDIVWSKNEGIVDSAKWFTDSSGIVAIKKSSDLLIEYFGVNAWTRAFPLDGGSLHDLEAQSGTVFSVVSWRRGENGKTLAKLYRCDVASKSLQCEPMVRWHERITSYAITPDGEVFFTAVSDTCIRRSRASDSRVTCEVQMSSDVTPDIVGLSKDRRFIAYVANVMRKMFPDCVTDCPHIVAKSELRVRMLACQ